jgi:hypothetical protein
MIKAISYDDVIRELDKFNGLCKPLIMVLIYYVGDAKLEGFR